MNALFVVLCVPFLLFDAWIVTSFSIGMAYFADLWTSWPWFLLIPAFALNILWVIISIAVMTFGDKGKVKWFTYVLAGGFAVKGLVLLSVATIHIIYFSMFLYAQTWDWLNAGFQMGNWITEIFLAVTFFVFAVFLGGHTNDSTWRMQTKMMPGP